MAPYNGARTKVQLKLTIQRCKMLQEKKEAMLKQARRDIASLVEKGKLETARIKTEGIICEDIHLELLELMELYCETLLARFALLDMATREPDPSIAPALCAVIHAAPRTELKELHVLRELLMSRYGRDFAQDTMDNADNCVPDRVIAKLVVETPDPKLVELYIFEICKAYDVPFSSELLPETRIPVEEDVDNAADATEDADANAGGEKNEKATVDAATSSSSSAGGEKSNKTSGTDEKPSKSTTAKSDSKPSSTTTSTTNGGGSTAAKKSSVKDEYDSLEARFAALKRR
ncbi:DUF292-domain-containing protein [Testicularia cyperi]|uniref:DUF292-domain-containing protein n=1 Tax=Testicularia cyperi TaxID=1882483 RepID=A0A317XSI1_9BASI|nr:DUF292-domain-containing protein [Testicularia cyperi]